jgi:hypothetical protein
MGLFTPHGVDLFGKPTRFGKEKAALSRAFIVPPFSVLSARDKEWQARKRAWISLGIKSEIGRGTTTGLERGGVYYGFNHTETKGRVMGRDLMRGENGNFGSSLTTETTGASIFDPVLTELIYEWFTPPDAQIIDPFAGGSVRGIVASILKRKYWGGELRPEQVAANIAQAENVCPDSPPVYVCGDSIETLETAPMADFIFSCPPYGDLEIYSDDPRDLSMMEWHTFCATYRRIILRACKKLRENRFACFVVGDFRDSRGFLRGFIGETIHAFKDQGLELYNEGILLTAVGSAPSRAGRQFNGGRKLCKVHQNFLVFCKGDWKRAAIYASRRTMPRQEVL